MHVFFAFIDRSVVNLKELSFCYRRRRRRRKRYRRHREILMTSFQVPLTRLCIWLIISRFCLCQLTCLIFSSFYDFLLFYCLLHVMLYSTRMNSILLLSKLIFFFMCKLIFLERKKFSFDSHQQKIILTIPTQFSIEEIIIFFLFSFSMLCRLKTFKIFFFFSLFTYTFLWFFSFLILLFFFLTSKEIFLHTFFPNTRIIFFSFSPLCTFVRII